MSIEIFFKSTKKHLTKMNQNNIMTFVDATQGILAQLGEHLPYKQRVIGSSPIGPICNINVAG